MTEPNLPAKTEGLSEDDVARAAEELMRFCRQQGWARPKSIAALNSPAATLQAVMSSESSMMMTMGLFQKFFGGTQ